MASGIAHWTTSVCGAEDRASSYGGLEVDVHNIKEKESKEGYEKVWREERGEKDDQIIWYYFKNI